MVYSRLQWDKAQLALLFLSAHENVEGGEEKRLKCMISYALYLFESWGGGGGFTVMFENLDEGFNSTNAGDKYFKQLTHAKQSVNF